MNISKETILRSGVPYSGTAIYSKDAVANLVQSVNETERAMRGMVNHDPHCMPIRKALSARLVESHGEYEAELSWEFGKRSEFRRIDIPAVRHVRLAFNESTRPFSLYSQPASPEKSLVSVDLVNFRNEKEVERFELAVENLDGAEMGKRITRHSFDPVPLLDIILSNPETLALLANCWIVWKLGRFADKVAEEMSDRLAERTCDLLERKITDLRNVFSRVRRKDNESIEIHVMIPGEETELILLMPSDTKGQENWMDPQAIQDVLDSYRPLLEDADSIVLSRQKGGRWNFEYMLTKDGCVIGTMRCYDRTMKLYRRIESHNSAVGDNTPSTGMRVREYRND